ncbi:MAG: BglG family transcription antiterminator [Eubacteriaceae bacterium]
MIITPRLAQLLKILIQSNKPIPVDDLASRINTSRRTIFRELEGVHDFLGKYGVVLEKKTGIGMWIDGTQENKDKLLSSLEPSMEILDRKERQERLILEILKEKKPQKIFYFANMFCVSESTISNDLDAVEPWFRESQLVLTKKPGYGVNLSGTEENYRRAMVKLIYRNINHWSPEVFSRVSPLEVIMDEFVVNQGSDTIYQLLNRDTLREVNRILESLGEERLTQIAESSYLGFVINLTLLVERIRKKEKLSIDRVLINEISKSANYDLAVKIGKYLETQFEIIVPIEEVVYICIYFDGAKPKYVDQDHFEENNKEKLTSLVHGMMDCYQASVAYELKLDEELIEGLIAHLIPTLTRLKHRIEIDNPLLDSVKENYPEIYQNSKKSAEMIEKTFGYPVPEDEIGFLALHFGAAMVRLENRRKNNKKLRIGVVCDSGIGISRLMGSRIKNIFAEKANIFILGKKELTLEKLDKLDFIVSTFEIEGTTKPILIVNPILLDEDIDKINAMIKEIKKLSHDASVQCMAVEKDFKEEFNLLQEMMTQMENILESFTITFVDDHKSVGEMIKITGGIIGENEEQRTQIIADIEKRERIASQIIPEFGFALFHTRTKGVKAASFSLILPRGERFTHKDFKNIFAIIVMLIPWGEEMTTQSKVMGGISTALIEDEIFLENIKNGEFEKIKAKLQIILKTSFKQDIQKTFDL